MPTTTTSYYTATRRGVRDDHVAGIATCVLAAVALAIRFYVYSAPEANCRI